MPRQFFSLTIMSAVVCALSSTAVFASSHREAPFISEMSKVDGTDFYMFRSYGPDSTPDSITLLANYQPLQDAYGGPNYFQMDPNALYEIHIDNNGDNIEDLTFQFRFTNTYRGASLPIAPPLIQGSPPQGVSVPLVNVGPGPNVDTVGPGVDDNDGLNVVENYQVTVVAGDRRSSNNPTPAVNMDATGDDNTVFRKPVDNIGEKTIPDYAAYAQNHIFDIDLSPALPACTTPGRVFVGQRKEGFVVNLGAIFDRVNLNPLGARDSGSNIIGNKNVTTLALEIPTSCLTNDTESVIGGWTTASLRQARVLNPLPAAVSTQDGEVNTPAVEGGPWTQVSRLGSPLVNEVVIGLGAKDRFNASEPAGDLGSFGGFVTFPTLPVLIDTLFPDATQVPATPRNDLVAAFVTGIRTSVNGTPTNFTQPQAITEANADTNDDGVIEPAELVSGGEMLRLNTGFPEGAPPELNAQNSLGFLACDLYGFPNGRRPIDDVVDIELSVAEGAIRGDDPATTDVDESNPNSLQTCDVSGATPAVVNAGAIINDGAVPVAADYLQNFPYLNTPLPGAVSP